MMARLLWIPCFSVFMLAEVLCVNSNNRPIIGIMSEEFSGNSLPLGTSFIMASYVKFVEASGARVVPILIYKSREYYQDILSKVNGILLTGGGDLLNSPGYGRTGKMIYDMVVEMNDKGDYFPIWGTCLGFEMLNFAAAKKMWMKKCNADDISLNINFADGFQNSKMFSDLAPKLKKKMQTENITLHLHHWCITPQNYSLSGLDKIYKVLAVNRDTNNEPFVSIIEGIKYPFYGVVFHPEKVRFNWSPEYVSNPHTAGAVEASQYFANFFISEARKNFHHFLTKEEENNALIYNYSPKSAGDDLSSQMYTFH